MNTRFFQKTHKYISGLLIACLLSSTFFFIEPKKAEAGFPVTDIGNLPTHVLNNINTYAVNIKEYLLDGLAKMVVQTMIRKITADIVTWINSGFKGNPSFVGNPQSFLKGLGAEILDNFINDQLNGLCSSFGAQIRINIAQRQQGQGQKGSRKLTCTLDILKNNYKKFMKSFKTGGLNTWFSITQTKQNNPYGAYLETTGALDKLITKKENTETKKLDWGRGFSSWEECDSYKAQTVYKNANTNEGPTKVVDHRVDTQTGRLSNGKVDPAAKCDKSHIATPGSTIQGQLDQTLPSSLRGLEVSDEINEIIGALAGQLMNQALGGVGGLLGTSQAKGGQKSYISKYQEDGDSALLTKFKKDLISRLDGSIRDIKTSRYLKYKLSTLSTLKHSETKVQALSDDLVACYKEQIASTLMTSDDITLAKEKMEEASTTLQDKVTFLEEGITEDIDNFNQASKKLNQMKIDLQTPGFTEASTTQTAEQYQLISKDIASASGAKTEADNQKQETRELLSDMKSDLSDCKDTLPNK